MCIRDRDKMSRLIGLAAFLALPSVILMMIFGQTRIFFSMARDRLLPDVLTRIHGRFNTPHVVTLVTGVGVVLALSLIHISTRPSAARCRAARNKRGAVGASAPR